MSYLNDKRNYHEVDTINLNSTTLVYKKITSIIHGLEIISYKILKNALRIVRYI